MNAVPETTWKRNVWMPESDRSDTVADYAETDLRQDRSAVTNPRTSFVSKVLHFAWQRVTGAFDSATAVALGSEMINRF